ncbi:hypothetical protein EYM_00700 [Ignicoccus islandicus DSM 13165]|uniref:Phosphoribulokinase/uridine kinase domain-containing protein n=1 Tax=Ignicoccus islandicus DSM 13165 TaxID=940295 RepID=A0A0U3FQG5_9CREN|nr:AAA family ATPase [Ignicoccus islandicus]ALU12135.1 hypothetical protein EYM_00700 [Ignicoccus islandicus DSM 13165]
MRISIETSDLREAAKVVANVINEEDVICIVGPSASGKSTLATNIAELLDGSVLSTDDFYLPDAEKMASVLSTFDHPALLDWELLLKVVRDALRGETEVNVPVYDMTLSRRIGYNKRKLKRPLVIEGIFASYGPLNELCKLKISVESPVHLLLARRALRDIERAQESPSKVIDRVVTTVLPLAKLFVEPQMRGSDVKVLNVWRPQLRKPLGTCEESEEKTDGIKGERRVWELKWKSELVFVIENFIGELVEHYVGISWENKSVIVRVRPETAYSTLSALEVYHYHHNAFYQKGTWKGGILYGKVYDEVSWKEKGSFKCCKKCIPNV